MIAAGTVAHMAVAPHAMNMNWIPIASATMPKNNGATVLAMLVDNELIL